MAVKHFVFNKSGLVLCGMEQKKNPLLTTDERTDVTCKRCLKKMKEVVGPEVDVLAGLEDLDSDTKNPSGKEAMESLREELADMNQDEDAPEDEWPEEE